MQDGRRGSRPLRPPPGSTTAFQCKPECGQFDKNSSLPQMLSW